MNKPTAKELKVILEKHRKWLFGEAGGERADLSYANLRAADLRNADLRNANLSDADLSAANLRAANLSYANLSDADLSAADLRNANLRAANLSYANLRAADLSDANLRAANLSYANLSDATVMPDDVAWSVYLEQVVPALLVAGGKTLEAVMATGCWECHSWDNCPMHAAFGAKTVDDVPPLYREQARRFVQLFDAGLIPLPKTCGMTK